eukprot:SM000210S06749  [mRNA]  locus=s210:143054:150941:- [translate_table: standard]
MSNAAAKERPRGRSQETYKSGHLLISSKGLGWKSWKRRWFLLTRTSLVFFKAEQPQKGSVDASMALGGIDLNNSGSVHVRADKKLMTVLFPDGRAFTLKAESGEELEEWQQALEAALAAAPSAALSAESDAYLQDPGENIDVLEYGGAAALQDLGGLVLRDRKPLKSLVVGRPILLALEEIDGSPSFLEKALTFVEQHGLLIEGILRESADVEDVERRVREYEQEIKKLPVRTEALRAAVAEAFPEPNRRLLQRLLHMMKAVAAHAEVNRMTVSAVSMCMAPLLLRPLLVSECKVEEEAQASYDNAAQIMAATLAANQAHLIMSCLMDNYEKIFKEEDALSMYTQDAQSSDEESYEEAKSHLRNLSVESITESELLYETSTQGGRQSDTMSEASTSGLDVGDMRAVEQAEQEGDYLMGIPGALKGVLGGARKLMTKERQSQQQTSQPGSRGHSRSPRPSYEEPAENGHGTRGKGAGSSGKVPQVKDKPAVITTRRSFWGLGTVWAQVPEAPPVNEDDTTKMQRLEVTRGELRSKLSREARANMFLKESVVRKKKTLEDRRRLLVKDVKRLREKLQRDAGEATTGDKASPHFQIDEDVQAELTEMMQIEADMTDLKKELAMLHLQLQQKQHRQGVKATSTAASMDRKKRTLALNALKAQLQVELERTMALCLSESFRTEKMEEESRRDDPAILESSVAMQRKALTAAQAALQSEIERGNELRLRAQAAQSLSPLEQVPVPSSSHRSGSLRSSNPYFSSTNRARQELANAIAADNSDGDYVGRGSSYEEEESKVGMARLQVGGPQEGEGSVAGEGGTGGSGGGIGNHQHLLASAALVELSSRLEHFKERRSQLIRQLSALSTEPSDGVGYSSNAGLQAIAAQDGSY